jgi:hypothetical protein
MEVIRDWGLPMKAECGIHLGLSTAEEQDGSGI